MRRINDGLYLITQSSHQDNILDLRKPLMCIYVSLAHHIDMSMATRDTEFKWHVKTWPSYQEVEDLQMTSDKSLRLYFNNCERDTDGYFTRWQKQLF